MHILRFPQLTNSAFFFLMTYMKQITLPPLDLDEISYCRVHNLAFFPASEMQDDAIWSVSFLCPTLTNTKRDRVNKSWLYPPLSFSPLWHTARCIFSLQTFHISSHAKQTCWATGDKLPIHTKQASMVIAPCCCIPLPFFSLSLPPSHCISPTINMETLPLALFLEHLGQHTWLTLLKNNHGFMI